MSPNIGLYYFPKVDSKVVLPRNFSFIGTLSAVLVIGIFIIHPSVLTMLMLHLCHIPFCFKCGLQPLNRVDMIILLL